MREKKRFEREYWHNVYRLMYDDRIRVFILHGGDPIYRKNVVQNGKAFNFPNLWLKEITYL